MSMECSCSCEDFDCGPEVYDAVDHRARKEHRCCECKATIKIGDVYERVWAIYEGDMFTAKTCAVCVRIRDDLCKCGFVHGELRQTIWDCLGVDYVTGKIREDDE